MKAFLFHILIFALFNSCNTTKNTARNEADIKEDIRQMEKAFNEDLLKNGVANAFYKFAAPNAVIKRENDTLIIGREAIRQYYSADFFRNAKAIWAPDFIDVSGDGTMASTYGKYSWEIPQTGKAPIKFSGVFHTVWKKQNAGSWKYIWD